MSTYGKPSYCINNQIACRPFPPTERKVQKPGLALTIKSMEVVGLEVVVGCITAQHEAIPAGAKVYVRASEVAQPWAKQALTFQGDTEDRGELIMVPVSVILFVEPQPGGVVPAQLPVLQTSYQGGA